MSKKLYLDCSTGISGDMTVAALLDLGADKDKLNRVLGSLKNKVTGFEVKISQVEKSGIKACDFDVILDDDNHDHDMDYLYGQNHDHHHDHEHHHEHHHNHDEHHHDDHDHEHHHEHHNDHDEHHHDHHDHDHHGHHHSHEGHTHEHRNLDDVINIINCAEMPDTAREIAVKVFTIVAEAESAVHGRSLEEVHFHEVGAIDSIVDIISAAVCYDDIKERYDLEGVVITRLVDGMGTVRCQHGVLPIPVPAVLKIAEQTGVPLGIAQRQGEYVTPTGAAFAAAIQTENDLPESFKVVKTGLGAGKREHEIPGILRAIIID